jgi:hypothetical protein
VGEVGNAGQSMAQPPASMIPGRHETQGRWLVRLPCGTEAAEQRLTGV